MAFAHCPPTVRVRPAKFDPYSGGQRSRRFAELNSLKEVMVVIAWGTTLQLTKWC